MVILIDDLQLTHTLFFIMTVLIYIAINGVSMLIHIVSYPWQYLLYISYFMCWLQSFNIHEMIVPYSLNWFPAVLIGISLLIIYIESNF